MAVFSGQRRKGRLHSELHKRKGRFWSTRKQREGAGVKCSSDWQAPVADKRSLGGVVPLQKKTMIASGYDHIVKASTSPLKIGRRNKYQGE